MMKVLCQRIPLPLQPLILYNLLSEKGYFLKPSFAPIYSQAASPLAYVVFSNSNTQGYPQE
ncbi:hypothetical protein EOI45_17950 [Salmonella enterica]|nr:hypothetical protein [Salmonella enterica]